jgi:protein-arginine kinase activator protein McsA
MKQKYCGTCKKDKDVVEFNKNKAKSDGLSTICRKCSNEHAKKYYIDHHKKMKNQINICKSNRVIENRKKLYSYLLTHPCIDCQENDPIVLEFDHVRGTKKEIVSKLVNQGFSWEVILNEIKKCEVRCANCHRRKTAKDFNWYKNIPS